ncbi:Zinc finger, GATA-type [Sesbania bispinosa]|nr:Zinc finger, GATA-type [Sesbania bispinosa]
MLPLDLNEEDHTHHQFFSTNYHQASSSLSYSILFNTDQGGSYCWGPKQLQSDVEEAEKIGSWDHPAVEKNGNDLKKEDGEGEDYMNSMKWMPSKMRILRRMMLSDQTLTASSSNEKQNSSPPPPLGIQTASNNNSSNNAVRVCADCHTTKTPLWRTGPTGPKENKFQSKGKKRSKTDEAKLQKKRKVLGRKPNKNKFSFEELRIRLSNKLPDLQQVFPQDEKEAAILLMALSHGFAT